MNNTIKDVIYLFGWIGILLMFYITLNVKPGKANILDVLGIIIGFIMMCIGFAMVETTKEI